MTKLERYAAFLRGVSPMNAKMSELKACFESAGFSDVKTLLSSGNVVFGARSQSEKALETKAEAAMQKQLGKSFLTIVRAVEELGQLIDDDPFGSYRLPKAAKRVVSFLREAPKAKLALPVEKDGARILELRERVVLTAYVPSPRGAVFMNLIEKTFGEAVTTRTWDTVCKIVAREGA
ncbi:MAG: DUF1697 domain-containing protein [Myxococcota bacterium]